MQREGREGRPAQRTTRRRSPVPAARRPVRRGAHAQCAQAPRAIGAASSPATGCRRDGMNDFGGTQDTPTETRQPVSLPGGSRSPRGRRQCLGGFTPHFSGRTSRSPTLPSGCGRCGRTTSTINSLHRLPPSLGNTGSVGPRHQSDTGSGTARAHRRRAGCRRRPLPAVLTEPPTRQ
jgi:hypothetical protein